MAIKAPIVKNILSNRRGFAVIDDAFTEYRQKAGLPELAKGSEAWTTGLWDFLDDCRGSAEGYKAGGEAGFIVVSYRRRASAGLSDAQFPDRILADDNRPKRPRAPRKNADGTIKVKTPEELAKELERENFMPALLSVDESHWVQADLEEEAFKSTVNWFGNLDETMRVSSTRLGINVVQVKAEDGTLSEHKVSGVWATVFVPDAVLKG